MAPVKTYTSTEAAVVLDVDVSRVLTLCREKRLGYTKPRHGRAWVITQTELDNFKRLKPGRKKKPRKKRLVRIDENGNHEWE
jgi:excisionase family DNA binding protein